MLWFLAPLGLIVTCTTLKNRRAVRKDFDEFVRAREDERRGHDLELLRQGDPRLAGRTREQCAQPSMGHHPGALGLDSSRDGFPPSKFLAPHDLSSSGKFLI